MAADDILAALQDPYSTAGDTYAGIGAGAVAQALPGLMNPYESAGTNALYLGGGSILAALLTRMAKDDAAETNAGIALKQSQFINGSPEQQVAMTQADPRTFAKLQAAVNGNALQQQAKENEYRRQLEIQQPFDIEKENRAVENEISKATDPRVLAAKNREAAKPAERLIKEGETIAKLDQVNKYIDEKFERAKTLTGKSAMIGMNLGIPTPEAAELTGLKDSVLVQIDNALGREMNSDVRQRLLSLTPTSYDSPEVIETKKQNMKELLASLSTPTPLTNSLIAQSAPPAIEKPNPSSFANFADYKAAKEAWRAAGGS
jgi:phosphohistidine swiveling domain-containing protein